MSALIRRLLLGVTLAPIVIGVLLLAGDPRDEPFDAALFAIANVVVVVLLIWWQAGKLLAAETAQEKREQWLSTTLTSIGDAVIATDAGGRVVQMNPVATALTGWAEAEALGRPLAEIFDVISEETRARVENPAALVLEHGQLVGLAKHPLLISKDGQQRPITASGASIKGAGGSVQGVVMIFRDQSAERRAEGVLRATELRFRRLWDAGMIGLMVVEGERVLEANDTFLAAVGRTREALATGTLLLSEVVPRESAEKLVKLKQPGFPPSECTLLHADGTLTDTVCASAQLDERTSLVFFLDLTELRAAQSAQLDLQKMTFTLEEQLRQSQKLEAVGALTGGIAHDFNNLLSVMLVDTGLLLEELPPGHAHHEYVTEIKDAANRAATLTRQLLAFGRRQSHVRQSLELNEAITHSLNIFKRVLPASIALQFIKSTTPVTVRVDPSQLDQVLMNLVVNARDAMPSGGKLTICADRLEVDEHTALRPGPYACITVQDDGAGMTPEVQARVFEPFFTTKEVGTGLGLATAFRIAQQSGGGLWVKSSPGEGATFTLCLPLESGQADALPAAHDSAALALATETILLVEDEESLRRLVARVLDRQGYEVLEACNGGEALILAERHRGSIDLLLTDVVMPSLSGRLLYERLSASRPELKLLFMSGYTDDTVVRHGVEAEGLALLQKPFEPHALLTRVREVLDHDRDNRDSMR